MVTASFKSWHLPGTLFLCLIYCAATNCGFTRSISLFDYCDGMIAVSKLEGYEINIDGRSFPVGKKTCHLQFYTLSSKDILLYRVMKSDIYKKNEEVSLDSSRDGGKYNSEEFMSKYSYPRMLNKEWDGDRFMNLSVYRESGHVHTTFSLKIQIYGEDYCPHGSDYTSSTSFSNSYIMGIVLGGICTILFVGFLVFYLKKTRCEHLTGRTRQEPRDGSFQGTSGPASTQTTDEYGLSSFSLPPTYYPPDHLAHLPPYTERAGDDIFIVQSNGPSHDLPPSYEETMKLGLREVTL